MENVTPKIKDSVLFVRINDEEKEAIAKAAARRDIPVSQFVRETIREKIAALATTEAETAGAAA